MNPDKEHRPDVAAFMKGACTTPGAGAFPPEIPTDRPTAARVYGWALGSKDNFAVDRRLALNTLGRFPEILDIARQNRQFLYRAVRYLARDVGITQFLDLGSGLPTENNVHQVAQKFQPEARVVYVDIDPIVLTHGRAILADNPFTTVITADMTAPGLLNHPELQRLLDFSKPIGVLLFSIPHCIPDDDAARAAVRGCIDSAPPGSVLALSHIVADSDEICTETTELIDGLGLPWQTRTPDAITPWLDGLEPVDPGLGDINHWHPDPDQPPLTPVPRDLTPFENASHKTKRVWEYGGLLRKTQS